MAIAPHALKGLISMNYRLLLSRNNNIAVLPQKDIVCIEKGDTKADYTVHAVGIQSYMHSSL